MAIILIMGLSGSGKTTLANKLQQDLNQLKKTTEYFNGNQIRQEYDDWDFTLEGRVRQGRRMRDLATKSKSDFAICDFIAPLSETQELFSNDIIIWMATIDESKYKDTDSIFVPPEDYSLKIKIFDSDSCSKYIINHIIKALPAR
jgi:adenylylsulfate kinase